jgi:hypothetical protein
MQANPGRQEEERSALRWLLARSGQLFGNKG